MTVVLTGDVHHAIGSADQRFTEYSEAALAVEYARIASRYNLKVTLFVTGRAILEDNADARPLLNMDNVKIGGHGWDALRPVWWHGALNYLIGSPHGPAWLQQRTILRTRTTIEKFTHQPVWSWRNHAYRYDEFTPGLLADAGIIAWSDEVNPASQAPHHHPDGVVILPINTIPDHENLYHGARTPESVAVEGPSYPPDQWCDQVCAQVEAIAQSSGVATILAHPICMKVADDWVTFTRLCSFLSHYPSLFASEAAERLCTS